MAGMNERLEGFDVVGMEQSRLRTTFQCCLNDLSEKRFLREEGDGF